MNSTQIKKHLTVIMMLGVAQLGATSTDNIKAQGGTGFTINNIRNFTFDENTIYLEDGSSVPGILAQGGTGFKVRFRIGNDVNQNVTIGTVEEVDFINTYKGPVTSINPLKVFDVDMLLTSNTYFDDVSLNDINLGDELKISGFIDANSTAIITRVELPDEALTEWKITGYVSNKTMTHFNIDNQLIEIDGTIDNCDSGLVDGEFVEVKATPAVNFFQGTTLVGVTEIECVSEDISTTPGEFIPVVVEGFVEAEDVDLNHVFFMSGQTYRVTGFTTYENGELEDVIVGAKLEVEGELNSTTSEILVNKVKFNEIRFRIDAPVMPTDVTVGSSIQILGQPVLGTPQLDDEDNVLENGLTVERSIEVRGFADEDGNLYATRIRDEGSPGQDEIRVEGKVTHINPPFFEVYGITIDTSTSILIDINGDEVDQATFFAQLSIGVEVEIEEGSVDDMTDIVSGGKIVIDEEDDDDSDEIDQHAKQLNGINYALGVGTVTSPPDLIFQNSFEN